MNPWLAEEIDYLEQHITDNLPKGLIHGDLFYDNLLFDPLSGMPGGFKAIIDFEEACHYHLIFELGMGMVGACVNDITVDLDKARALTKSTLISFTQIPNIPIPNSKIR